MQQSVAAPSGASFAAAALAALAPGVSALVSTNATHERHDGFLVHEDASRSRDHPPGADYRTETEIARISVTAEAAIAFVWILMVCSAPMVAIKLEGHRLTRSQLKIFVVMWITFLGGIYLFTNVLLFESVHFEGVRSLTIVECVYLFTQILTTVGYGDIVPARPRAQVFVGLYVIFNLMIIANVMTDVSELIAQHTREYYKQLHESVSQQLVLYTSASEDEAVDTVFKESERGKVRREFIRERMPSLPWMSLARSSGLFLLWCVLGVFFFTYYPGEDRTVFEAIYMSVISLSTVGFGVYTPITEAGKVFGSFWMLFGSGTLVAVVSNFTELMAQMRGRERFIKEYGELKSSSLYHDMPERLDLYDFTRFALVYSNFVDESTLTLIDDTFQELGPSDEGQLSKEAVQTMLDDLRKSCPVEKRESDLF